MSPLGITLLMLAGFAVFACAGVAQALDRRRAGAGKPLRPALEAPASTAADRLRPVAAADRRLPSRADACSDLLRLPDAAGAQTASDRHRLRPARDDSRHRGRCFTPRSRSFIELAVLVAVGYGFLRRFVRPPARLEPNREAIADPDADRADHDHRLRLRRVPVRAACADRSPRSRTKRPGHGSARRCRRCFPVCHRPRSTGAPTRSTGCRWQRSSPSWRSCR